MSVAELNTLHTVCEVERTQLLTILAMSVENQQLAGFLLTQNCCNFLYVEGSTAWLYDCTHHLSPLFIVVRCYETSLYIMLTLSCMLTLSLVNFLNTLIKYHVKTTQKILLLLTLTLINTLF